MNKKALHEAIAGIRVVQAGVAKIAELHKSAKTAAAAAPSEEDQKICQELAGQIASKMASMRLGSARDVAANTQSFASDHKTALECTNHLMDIFGANGDVAAKVASSPSSFGSASRSENKQASVKPEQQLVPRIRC